MPQPLMAFMRTVVPTHGWFPWGHVVMPGAHAGCREWGGSPCSGARYAIAVHRTVPSPHEE